MYLFIRYEEDQLYSSGESFQLEAVESFFHLSANWTTGSKILTIAKHYSKPNISDFKKYALHHRVEEKCGKGSSRILHGFI